MSSKINIFKIISGHLWTLKDSATGKISKWDITLFILIPISIGAYAATKGFVLPKGVVSSLLNIGVLLSALLLNLLVIVYTLKERLPKVDCNKEGWKVLELKHAAMLELYYNISASVLIAFCLLILSLTHNLLFNLPAPFDVDIFGWVSFSIPSLNGNIVDPLLIFLGLNLVLTFLMIIKRTYLLLVTDSD